MQTASIITAVIAVISALSGIIFGWSARARDCKKELKSETRTEAETDATLRADMEYIKRGVDDIRLEQRAQGQKMEDLAERITRVEESAKQAHKRIDDLIKH